MSATLVFNNKVVSNDTLEIVVLDYAKAAGEIISSNTPQGFNCTINLTEISCKKQNNIESNAAYNPYIIFIIVPRTILWHLVNKIL